VPQIACERFAGKQARRREAGAKSFVRTSQSSHQPCTWQILMAMAARSVVWTTNNGTAV
jgi:hypothetical protein